jgi:hypothetical protein
MGVRNGRGDTDDANLTHPIVARFWRAVKLDMTMTLGLEGVEDGHVCREGGMPRYFFCAKHGQVTILDQESAELADIDEAAKEAAGPGARNRR